MLLASGSESESPSNMVAILNLDTLELKRVEEQPEGISEARITFLYDGAYYIFLAKNLLKGTV